MNIIKKFEIELISATIKNGGTIVLPFDTVYGIIADPLNFDAIQKIYKVKGRDFNKPIALIFSSVSMLKRYLEVDKDAEDFVTKKIPGPYTFIFPWTDDEKIKFAPQYQKLDKIGVRIPDSKYILDLVDYLDQPIAATSANISGEPNCWSADEFVSQIKNNTVKPYLIFDGGPIEKNQPSQVIDISSLSDIKVLRK